MKRIDGDLILKDMKLKEQLMLWIIISLVVFVAVLSPILIFKQDFVNACIEAIVLFAFVGIPVGYRWGIKRVMAVLELIISLKRDEYVTKRKRIIDKKKIVEDESYYKMFFDEGEIADKEGIIVDYSIYSKASIGDEYILVYEKKNKSFLKMYSTKNYYL